MPSIQGTYFDGNSSKPNPVRVEFTDQEIRIFSLEDNDPTGIIDIWYIHKLEDVDFSSSDTVHLKYGDFPHQSLLIDDSEDVLYFRRVYPEIGQKNIYRKILSGNIYKVLGVTVSILVAVTAFYLLVAAPFVAEKAAALIPMKAEVVLGEKMTEHLFASMTFDEEKSAALNEFFEATGFESDYPVELYVEESQIVNAFAVPGGKIVIYQGIIDDMENWEELAGLLGHELAHVEQRHSLKAMCRNLSTYFVFSVMTGDASGISAVLVEKTLMLKDMANSRSAETEADEWGFQYLVDQEINPKGIVHLFETMQKSEIPLRSFVDGKTTTDSTEIASPSKADKNSKDYLDKFSQMMSTHPLTEERIEYLSEKLAPYLDQEFPENPRAADLFERLKDRR